MRVVFMGTPAFAATCLQRIANECEIVGVYTKPDTPKNRGMKLQQSEVKQAALALGLPVYQPTTFKDEVVVNALRGLAPELIVVVAYGKILPQAVLDIPPKGCINIHGSLLPALRGAAPVQWAILNGLHETGVTAMYLSAGMDEGDMIAKKKTPIGERETAGELMDRLAVLGAELLSETMTAIENGAAKRTPQDPALATYAPMLTRELSPIDWTKPAREILCQIHGLDPWPSATATLAGTEFKIFNAEIVELPSETAAEQRVPLQGDARLPSTPVALDKKGLTVLCGDGAIRITELQAQGGKRMRAPDYFRGHPIVLGKRQ